MSSSIDYGNLMHRAMRGLIQEVLADVAENGLPGNHHFFITFDTTHEGAALADWLRERYPNEMTVVLQHWYDNLEVGDDGFGITLNFGDSPESLYIPFDAIQTFVDPSVEFGLRFETQGDKADADTPEAVEPLRAERDDDTDETPDVETEEKQPGSVVQLDKFRK